MGGSLPLLILFTLLSLPLLAYGRKIAEPPPVLEGPLSLIIHVKNLRCCEGILRLAVYHDKAYWMRDDGMVRGRIGMVTAAEQTLEIHGLPPGEYAIALHQDVNSDGKFNRVLGIFPKEPYGFSNNVGEYGPASFEKATVQLTEDKEITLFMHKGPGKK